MSWKIYKYELFKKPQIFEFVTADSDGVIRYHRTSTAYFPPDDDRLNKVKCLVGANVRLLGIDESWEEHKPKGFTQADIIAGYLQ